MCALDVFIGMCCSLVFSHAETLHKCACEALTTEQLKTAQAPACPSKSKDQEGRGTSQMIDLNL